MHSRSIGSHTGSGSGSSGRVSVSMFSKSMVENQVTVAFIVFLRVAGWVLLPASFILLFIFFFSLSVAISLVVAKWITIWLWKSGRDPDTYALPIQSSLVDLISQLLLVACYIIAGKVGADVGPQPKQ